MHFVDEARAKVLLNRSHAASKPDVSTVSRLGGVLERRVDAIGNKVEGCAAVHFDRRPRMVGEHEYRSVIHRIVAPPTSPGIVRPWSSNWSEHVSAHDPSADVVESLGDEIVVYSGCASLPAKHGLKRSGGEGPFMQTLATCTEGILQVLVGAGAVAVDGYRKAMDAKSGHRNSF